MTTAKSFDLPHGRSVHVEEVDKKVTSFTLDAPTEGGVYVRIARWGSVRARSRGELGPTLGLELDREAAEALFTLLAELLTEPDVFGG